MTLEQALQLAEQYATAQGITWKPACYIDLVSENSLQRDTPADTAKFQECWQQEIGTWQILVETDATAPAGLIGFRVDDKTGVVTPVIMPFLTRLLWYGLGERITAGFCLLFPKLDPTVPRPVAPTLALLAVMAWMYSWILEIVLIVLQLFFQRKFSWQLHLTFIGIGACLSLIAWLRKKDIAKYGYGFAPVQYTPFQAGLITVASFVLVVLVFLVIAGKLK
jgi:hypothetical protein